MGDYLDTVVKECNVGYASTEAVLSYEVKYVNAHLKETVIFRLPFEFYLKKGDKLSFYQGIVVGSKDFGERFIGDYVSVDIYREKDLLARFEKEKLDLLELVKEKI